MNRPHATRATPKHAWLVHFSGGPPVVVLATEAEDAARVAIYQRKTTGYTRKWNRTTQRFENDPTKKAHMRVVGRPRDLGHRGSDKDTCPRCGGMFQPFITTEEN